MHVHEQSAVPAIRHLETVTPALIKAEISSGAGHCCKGRVHGRVNGAVARYGVETVNQDVGRHRRGTPGAQNDRENANQYSEAGYHLGADTHLNLPLRPRRSLANVCRWQAYTI